MIGWRRLACGLALAITTPLACTRDADGGRDRFRPLSIGEIAPEYTARTLDGDTIRVGPGEPLTLVNIWATWCIPCEKEFPDLERIQQEFGQRGLRVLAVSIDNGGDEAVRRFARRHAVTFTIARDPDGNVKRTYQAIGVPASYLIGPDGTVRWRQAGAIPAGGGTARTAITASLSR